LLERPSFGRAVAVAVERTADGMHEQPTKRQAPSLAL
jgi:hypothetical protein